MTNIKIDKLNIYTLAISSIIFLTPITSYANNDITIDPSFTYKEDGYWKPGRIESKDFYINNNKSKDIIVDRLYFNLKSCEYWKTGEKLDIDSNKFKELAKYSTVTLTHNGKELFKDTMANILSKDGVLLSNEIYIRANGKELLNMTIDMDLDMNNDAQALDTILTIGLAYKMDITNPPEPPIEPEPPIVSPDEEVGQEESDKLPQTGGIINATSLSLLGMVTIGVGIALNKKSGKEKGGKRNE